MTPRSCVTDNVEAFREFILSGVYRAFLEFRASLAQTEWFSPHLTQLPLPVALFRQTTPHPQLARRSPITGRRVPVADPAAAPMLEQLVCLGQVTCFFVR